MIWLIGNQGQLGSDVEQELIARKQDYWASDREVDITDCAQVEKIRAAHNIRWIINCAAYTHVDNAERERDAAFEVNVRGVENLVKIFSPCNTNIIHVSTDYVFDGTKQQPYEEEDHPQPLSVYGLSKLESENILRKYPGVYYIIRTAWLYGHKGSNFVHKVVQRMQHAQSLRIVNDQHGTPTYTKDLARAIGAVQAIQPKQGIYHFTNEGTATWYDFACEIYKQLVEQRKINKNISIDPITSDEFLTLAKRPHYSVLSKAKIKKALRMDIRPWQAALKEFLQEYAL